LPLGFSFYNSDFHFLDDIEAVLVQKKGGCAKLNLLSFFCPDLSKRFNTVPPNAL